MGKQGLLTWRRRGNCNAWYQVACTCFLLLASSAALRLRAAAVARIQATRSATSLTFLHEQDQPLCRLIHGLATLQQDTSHSSEPHFLRSDGRHEVFHADL